MLIFKEFILNRDGTETKPHHAQRRILPQDAPAQQVAQRGRRVDFKMTTAEALKRYAGATPFLSPREVRKVGHSAGISGAESKYDKR